MPFDDNDLKRLKELVPKSNPLPNEVNHLWYKLGPLLARLEASERCMVPSTDYCAVCHCEDCESSRRTWRKAAGK